MRTAATARLVSSRSPNASEMAPLTTSSSAASPRSSTRKVDRAHAATLCAVPGRARTRQQQARMRQPRDPLRVVAHQHDHAPGQHLEADQLLGERGGLRIERGGRLVEQQHARLVGHGADQPQPLALARRQLGYGPVEQRRVEAQRRKQPVELGVRRRDARARSGPPGGLGRRIAHAPPPLGARHLAALHAFERRRSPRRGRGRRSRAAAWSCRSPTDPRRQGTPAPAPRRTAQAAPAPSDCRSSASAVP